MLLTKIFNQIKKKINILNLSIKFFFKKYIYTINHKRLGLNYFFFSLITAMSGSLLATAIRLEMAFPGSPFFNGDSLKYLQVITAHGLIMIFFVIIPILFGGFANFLLPYHIGSKDVAFPRLNSLGFWIQPSGYLLIAKISILRTEFWKTKSKVDNYFSWFDINENKSQITFSEFKEILTTNFFKYWFSKTEMIREKSRKWEFVPIFNPTEKTKIYSSWKLIFWKFIYLFPESFLFLLTNSYKLKRRKRHVVKCSNSSQTVSGWTFITPFSSNTGFTGVGIQDMLILGVYFSGISTTISLVNLLITKRTLSMPGLRTRRILLPFISITILLMLRTLAIITPVLGSAMLMLILDRHWKTSFFDFSYGGDPIFFHHLFWFFGHPEVYVLVIPAFGIINTVLPYVSSRRLASKHHLIWAVYIMNYMGFLVWGHHMYLIGLDHRSRALYSTITIMISLPATIKIVNWTFTLTNGMIKINVLFIGIISFILFFLVAGLTGMWLSHVSLNISMHDTLYVVAHFHLMLSGAVMTAIFVGYYFYFNLFFQLKYSKTFAYFHIIFYSGGQWITFIPLFWLSFSGLPRRVHDFPTIFTGWQGVSTTGHLITMIGVFFFYLLKLDSYVEKKQTFNTFNILPKSTKRLQYYNLQMLNIKLLYCKYNLIPNKHNRLLFINN